MKLQTFIEIDQDLIQLQLNNGFWRLLQITMYYHECDAATTSCPQ